MTICQSADTAGVVGCKNAAREYSASLAAAVFLR